VPYCGEKTGPGRRRAAPGRILGASFRAHFHHHLSSSSTRIVSSRPCGCQKPAGELFPGRLGWAALDAFGAKWGRHLPGSPVVAPGNRRILHGNWLQHPMKAGALTIWAPNGAGYVHATLSRGLFPRAGWRFLPSACAESECAVDRGVGPASWADRTMIALGVVNRSSAGRAVRSFLFALVSTSVVPVYPGIQRRHWAHIG